MISKKYGPTMPLKSVIGLSGFLSGCGGRNEYSEGKSFEELDITAFKEPEKDNEKVLRIQFSVSFDVGFVRSTFRFQFLS